MHDPIAHPPALVVRTRWQPMQITWEPLETVHESFSERSTLTDISSISSSPTSPTSAHVFFQSMTRDSLPLLLNQALLSTRMGDHMAAVEIISDALTRTRPSTSSLPSSDPQTPPTSASTAVASSPNSECAFDPRLEAFTKWLRGIARSEWGEEAPALQDFHSAESIFNSQNVTMVDLECLGLSFTLHLYEIKFNAAVCLWRMGLIDDSAQELADARPFAVTKAHIEAFEEVMQSGFDPPGLFRVPEEALFGFPDDPSLGWAAVAKTAAVETEAVVLSSGSLQRRRSSADLSSKPLPPIAFDDDDEEDDVVVSKESDAGAGTSVVEPSSSPSSSSFFYDPRLSDVPPVPPIPPHMLAKVRKDSFSNSTSPTSSSPPGSSSPEGLSSVAAAVLVHSTMSPNTLKSQEEAEREFAEALAAAQAYRDSWTSEQPSVTSTNDDSAGSGSVAESLYDEEDELPDLPMPGRMGGMFGPIPVFSKRVSSMDVRKYIPQISVGGEAVEAVRAADAASEKRDVEYVADGDSSTITSAPNTEIFPELSLHSRTPSPTPVDLYDRNAELNSATSITPTALHFTLPPIVSSPPSSLPPAPSDSSPASNVSLNISTDMPIESHGSFNGGRNRIAPQTHASPLRSVVSTAALSNPSKDTLDFLKQLPSVASSPDLGSSVQIRSPLPRDATGTPVFKDFGFRYNHVGSLPGGMKRLPPRSAMSSPSTSASPLGQIITPPTTPSPTRLRADSSAPTMMSPPPLPNVPLPNNSPSRPRATTFDSGSPIPAFASHTPPTTTHQLTTAQQKHHLAYQQHQQQLQQQQLQQQQQQQQLASQPRTLRPAGSSNSLPQRGALAATITGGIPSSPTSPSTVSSPLTASSPNSHQQITPPSPATSQPPVFPSVAAVGSVAFHRPRATTLDSSKSGGTYYPAPVNAPLPSSPTQQTSSTPVGSPPPSSPISRPRAITLESSSQPNLSPTLKPSSTTIPSRTGLTSPLSPKHEQRMGRWVTPPSNSVSITARTSSLGGTLPPPHPKWLAKHAVVSIPPPTAPPPSTDLPPTPLSTAGVPPPPSAAVIAAVLASKMPKLPPPKQPAPTKPLPPTPGTAVTELLEVLDGLGDGEGEGFLAYADYLVALDEVLQKDLGDKHKHQSFFTVCSDDDDDESVAPENSATFSKPDDEDARSEGGRPWSAVIDAILARRFSILPPSPEPPSDTVDPSGEKPETKPTDKPSPKSIITDSDAISLFPTSSETSSLFKAGSARTSLRDSDILLPGLGGEDDDAATDAVAREFLRAFQRGEYSGKWGGHLSTLASSVKSREKVRESVVSSLEMGSEFGDVGSPESGSAVALSLPLSSDESAAVDDDAVRYLSFLDAHPSTARGETVVPWRRVISFLDSEAGDSESTMSMDAISLAYRARELDSFYEDSGPDYRDSFQWQGGEREPMRHPSWAITESTPGLAVEERKDSGSEVTVFGEMVNGPMPDKLVPATALGNGGQELAGGGGGHFGGFGSLGRLHTKAKETGITRRIVDFVMKHVEKYTEAHATVQNGEDAMNVTTPSIPPRTQDASLLLLQALSLPDIESFLYVRFEAWGAYKRRWCILRDSSLYIVKSPTDLRLVAVLAITSNTDILPDPDASKHLGTGHHRYGFKICPRKTGEEVQETEDEDEEVISALIDSVYANLDEPQRKTPSASPSPAHPVLHLAAEHQLTVVNWIGHLARSARGEKRVGPRTLIPLRNKTGEQGRIPMTISPSLLASSVVGSSYVAASAGNTPSSTSAPPSVLSGTLEETRGLASPVPSTSTGGPLSPSYARSLSKLFPVSPVPASPNAAYEKYVRTVDVIDYFLEKGL